MNTVYYCFDQFDHPRCCYVLVAGCYSRPDYRSCSLSQVSLGRVNLASLDYPALTYARKSCGEAVKAAVEEEVDY